ncbi:MAG: NAD(P)H-dependent oxidoreductase subunit E [Nocardioides sp.]|uniref:NADH-quinone oxidoreductase subunit NuoE family protein n=1 Tax=Nocardioides sp. TaxID=35761 RepID=UPI0039E631D4
MQDRGEDGVAGLADVVRSVVEAHRHERGPLLVILQDLQHRLRHVPADAVPLIAAELNLSRADVHGVLSFYHDLRDQPVGRTIVQVCRAEACQAVGAEALVSAVEDEFGMKVGETTADGSLTLDQVFCLGNCALGPSILVDGRVHGRVRPEDVAALAKGQA